MCSTHEKLHSFLLRYRKPIKNSIIWRPCSISTPPWTSNTRQRKMNHECIVKTELFSRATPKVVLVIRTLEHKADFAKHRRKPAPFSRENIKSSTKLPRGKLGAACLMLRAAFVARGLKNWNSMLTEGKVNCERRSCHWHRTLLILCSSSSFRRVNTKRRDASQ